MFVYLIAAHGGLYTVHCAQIVLSDASLCLDYFILYTAHTSTGNSSYGVIFPEIKEHGYENSGIPVHEAL